MGTSLAPVDIEKQKMCVKTWIDSEFEVISFNVKEEIELLKPHFEEIGVEFFEVHRSAKEVADKTLPYLADILHMVADKTEKICGYFNSDIYLYGVTAELQKCIYEEAENNVIFVRRNEISSYEDIRNVNWKIHFDGIDVFFVNKNQKGLFDQDDFFVQSAWDMFILQICALKQLKVKELINPIAFHISHPIKWNFEMQTSFAEKFALSRGRKKENAYENALKQFYIDIYNIEKICFCKDIDKKCLFVLPRKGMKLIGVQDYSLITIAEDDSQKEAYDYIFYVNENAILDAKYCKAVIYIMERFSIDELEVGAFFASEIDGKWQYNNLNRSIAVVYDINETCEFYSRIVRNGSARKKNAKLCYPLLSKLIANDEAGIECTILKGRAYLMPAGVRACEWYRINASKLKELEIVGYIDNNKDKIGTEILGQKIYDVENAIERDKEAFVVVASKYYGQEIKEQLKKKIEERRIIDTGYIVEISQEGKTFLLNLEKYKTNRD